MLIPIKHFEQFPAQSKHSIIFGWDDYDDGDNDNVET